MTPTDDMHAQALKLARTYLGQEDLDGGWFELGGSSLDAARLVSSLEHDHGWEIALQDLLTAPSVAGLLTAPAAAVAPEAPDAPSPTPVAAATGATSAGGADVLWPALARLSASERLTLAHRLLGDVLRESGEPR
ncbi:acyl carrier protein [Streptomyces chromofuscus]|uniref:Acyl carrier protein n=2 Tax=Streptomyces chromofuscus TaxID=42881 RepID=A0A7M2T4U9_STRCW|nr:acyl carrier protein [Streptomyces chromofuscus]QOV43707.1 acyl carrier protein [Streptomyces chromofuscus]